jgi:EmrB/QacA subfamily drug resistance transporter
MSVLGKGGVGPQTARSVAAAVTPARRGLIFAVVCAGFVMSNLDLTLVNVAFPAIKADFQGSSLDGLSWVLNGYSIVFAALLVPAGRLSDRASRKTGYLLGLGLFTVASALCAVAQNTEWLVGARVLQAAGAAALTPTSLGLLLAAYPPDKRPRAVRAWAAVGSVASALGPVLGGLIVNVDWRWAFVINVPFGVAAALVGLRVLPTVRVGDRGPLPDILGSTLLIISISLIALGVIEAPKWGWVSDGVLASLIGGLALLAAFGWRSVHHPNPVISASLLRIPAFSHASATAFVFGLAFAAMLLSFTLWCQNVLGYSALQTGLALAPGTVLMPLLAMVTGPLSKKIGAHWTTALGCIVIALGSLWWAVKAQQGARYAVALLPGVILTIAGTVVALTTLIGAATVGLPSASFATGSGAHTMTRQIGYVLGVSIFVAVIGAPNGPAAMLSAFRHGWIVIAVCATGAAALALTIPRGPTTESVKDVRSHTRSPKEIQ